MKKLLYLYIGIITGFAIKFAVEIQNKPVSISSNGRFDLAIPLIVFLTLLIAAFLGSKTKQFNEGKTIGHNNTYNYTSYTSPLITYNPTDKTTSSAANDDEGYGKNRNISIIKEHSKIQWKG